MLSGLSSYSGRSAASALADSTIDSICDSLSWGIPAAPVPVPLVPSCELSADGVGDTLPVLRSRPMLDDRLPLPCDTAIEMTTH